MYGVPSFDISSFFSVFFDLFTKGGSSLFGDGMLSMWWQSFYPPFRSVSNFISLLLLTGIIYSLIRLLQIRAVEHKVLHHGSYYFEREATTPPAETSQGLPPEAEPPGRAKWQLVERHLLSENPGDWRLAVLEADIILDELVRALSPLGDNLGERLKNLDATDFRNIDKAWEAHKIRNAIAHEGADFVLSQREAKRIIGLYEQVFRDSNYI